MSEIIFKLKYKFHQDNLDEFKPAAGMSSYSKNLSSRTVWGGLCPLFFCSYPKEQPQLFFQPVKYTEIYNKKRRPVALTSLPFH